MGGGIARRLFDLALVGARPAVGDVGAHGVVEQHDLLADQGDVGVERGESHVANVGIVDGDAARIDIVEAGE